MPVKTAQSLPVPTRFVCFTSDFVLSTYIFALSFVVIDDPPCPTFPSVIERNLPYFTTKQGRCRSLMCVKMMGSLGARAQPALNVKSERTIESSMGEVTLKSTRNDEIL